MSSERSILFVIPYGYNDRMMNFMDSVLGRILAKNGWKVACAVQQEKGQPLHHNVQGVEVFRYAGTASAIALVFKLLVKGKFDVVHIITLRNNHAGIIAAVLAKLRMIPVVFSEAGLLHDHYLVDDRDDPLGKPIHATNVVNTLGALLKACFHGNPLFFLRSYIFHWPLTHADEIVFFSKHNVQIASNLGCKCRYIPQILDGLRWDSDQSSTEDVDKIEGLPASYALFVGQMKLRKGWDVLLQAIPHVDRSAINKFVFVSATGKAPDEFNKLCRELSVEERVVFLGAVESNTTLQSIFKRSSVVVVPSRYEGFGLVPFDAFEVGVPVVASRVEALTDFLRHEENAYLVEPKDPAALAQALSTVASDSTLRTRIIEGGRQSLAFLRSPLSHHQWLNFYDSLFQ